ncbi:aldo/keto reductase [Streptomyces sp. VRA16 Mangrove soil]|uniref:aldo/keto reductase n=1 Tax=Streptomyces sp. VRA16 Mangrove soil TaxID=2817434 RepID=UPI001A9CBC69|nr:aldo/keto reductase [Streptomyces sp. VRA16 Mangrove soil]MBO1332064.1 aldo/keto reductase [Streptomyces sp. VRA16 Mangrove soil]
MRTRTLGRTDVPVTALGFGAAVIGNLFTPVRDDEAYAALDTAWDAGIRYFDTAPHYGVGVSERRVGEFLRTRPTGSYTLSTKVGRLLEPADDGGAGGAGGDDSAHGFATPATHRRVWDFSAAGVRRSIEDSLGRLGLDRIDVVYLHDPDDHAEQAFGEAYPELERLRAEGVVGAIGAGMNQAGMLTRFVRDTDVDVVLCAGRYSLLDQRALSRLLPAATERGVSVIVGGVFNSGLLADPKQGATFDYGRAAPALVERALKWQALAERHGTTLRAAALAFPGGHPAVTGVLVGTRSAAEVSDTVAQFTAEVPAALWQEARDKNLLAADVPTPGTREEEPSA